MLLVFQWEFGAASTPSRTGIKEKECIDLMLGNQAADWVTGVPGDCAAVRLSLRWPSGTVPALLPWEDKVKIQERAALFPKGV